MVTRLISAKTSEIMQMRKEDLKASIKASEGRVICSESTAIYKPPCDVITNAEMDRSFGADLILVNCLDVNHPWIAGLNEGDDSFPDYDSIHKLKTYVGRPVGLNLEPVNAHADMLDKRQEIKNGRIVTIDNLKKADKLGFDFVCLTGNPRTGVDNAGILKAIALAKQHFEGLIFAGKMHSAGVNEKIMDEEMIEKFVDAGADVILVPAVGSVPGISEEELTRVVKLVHAKNALVMSAIGTSQEGASSTVIEQMAIRCKICGVDIQHIGDCSQKENIFVMSMAIRGQRHTYNRMALSIRR